ncbi:MAG: sensor histidine kinase [Pyrinomonadaceae bacterium]
MNSLNSALLVNLLGFTVGVSLYGLLLVMVVRHRQTKEKFPLDFLLLATSVLGLLWNVGELFSFIWRDFRQTEVSPVLSAVAYSALGFLPSVVVHSAWKNSESRSGKILTIAAYGLSVFAAALHFQSAFFFNVAPSNLALRILTFGSLALLGGLLIFNFKQTRERKTVWISALLIFAVSALHLSGGAEEKSWLVELVAHQSSLPLALAILLQDYRFAFADLFLKRALSLILLALTAFGLYIFVAAPLLYYHETHAPQDAQAIALILTLWMATALVYPALHKFAVWLVDTIILRRANYETLRVELARAIEKQSSAEAVLRQFCEQIKPALTAQSANWTQIFQAETNLPQIFLTRNEAEIFIPVTEPPFYQITLKNFAGGRNLLSDEIEMLSSSALLTARKIDALRVTDERHSQELREREFSRLATEARLSALRAQINPHFLFNALTTIGYLIQSAPDKAFETLMRLTSLLRGVLRSTGEFSTLGEELKIIESYLEIERARFEERLSVKIEVSPELRRLKIPSLVLQPLVENAVKHGISNSKHGGEVRISARIDGQNLTLEVSDTGAGLSAENLSESRKNGVGLNNIEQRLKSHFGAAARLEIQSEAGSGTKSKIVLPLDFERAAKENLSADKHR